MIEVLPLTPELERLKTALFDAAGSPCHCRYWHFTGDKNAWLERCAFSPETNRDEQAALVASGDPAGRGLLAVDLGRAIGWMKLAPRAALPKLRRQGPYRLLDLGPDDGVYAIGCLLVAPDRRGQGVARALVAAADDAVRAWGGRAVEAFPRRAAHRLHPEEAWVGTEEFFLALGYAIAHGDGPYPVMRKELAAARG